MQELKWWQNAVVYQIYPRSFQDSDGDGIGDIRGVINRLPYLVDLGIDAIWFSPIFKSPNVDNGYDISDYQDIMDEFGTMADFDELMAKCNEHGIKIILDLVVNHSSDQHAWFLEAKQNPQSEVGQYYHWHEGFRDEDGKAIGEPNRWGSVFGGSTWEYVEDVDMYYLHSFAIEQPDLNWENPELREEVYKMMRWWCDKGVAGFRMDVINLINKPEPIPMEEADGTYEGLMFGNAPGVHDYLQEMNREVMSHYDLLTVGETGGVRPEDAYKYSNLEDTELSMIFQFEHVDDLDKDGPHGRYYPYELHLPVLKDIFTRWQEGLYGKAWNSLFWCNHDQPRVVTRWGSKDEKWREKSAKMLAHVLHFQQGTPYIYQGEELGMTNMPFESPAELRDIAAINWIEEAVRTGEADEQTVFDQLMRTGRDHARTPMQWDDSMNAGFSSADETWIGVNANYTHINAAEQVKRKDSVYSYYKELIRLRHEKPLITHGRYELFDLEDENTFSYARETETEALYVSANFGAEEQVVNVPAKYVGLAGEVWLSTEEDFYQLSRLEETLVLPPYATIAFAMEQ